MKPWEDPYGVAGGPRADGGASGRRPGRLTHDGVIAHAGRAHAVVAPPKAGKSLLTLALVGSACVGSPTHPVNGRTDGTFAADSTSITTPMAPPGMTSTSRLDDLGFTTAEHRADSHHLAEMKANAQAIRPRLIVLDPLYLSLSANMASLNEVGAELRELQPVAEDVGAALAVVHHWNKTGTGTGAGRMSGAGAEQWGRVLWSVSVGSRSTDPDRELSSVVGLDVELIGGELSGLSYSVRRTVWSDDPDDLSSPMHYEVTASPLAASSAGAKDKTSEGLSARSGPGRCLAILKAEPSRWFTVDEVQDRTADEADEDPSVRPLKRDTVGKALGKLHEDVHADRAHRLDRGAGPGGGFRRQRASTSRCGPTS